MYGRGTLHRSSRHIERFLNLFHILCGLLIVILAVISFWNPEKNLVLFPVIFLLAAVWNLVNGWERLQYAGTNKKKKAAGIATLILGVILIGVTVVSAIGIW